MKIFSTTSSGLFGYERKQKKINFVSQELQAKNKYFRKIPPSKRNYAVEVFSNKNPLRLHHLQFSHRKRPFIISRTKIFFP